MAECECLPGCIFFNNQMATMPVTAQSMKNRLCLGEKEDCARYMVFSSLGKPRVPADLYPNNVERARQIIAAEKALVSG